MSHIVWLYRDVHTLCGYIMMSHIVWLYHDVTYCVVISWCHILCGYIMMSHIVWLYHDVTYCVVNVISWCHTLCGYIMMSHIVWLYHDVTHCVVISWCHTLCGYIMMSHIVWLYYDVTYCVVISRKLKRGIRTHFCRPNIAMGYPPSWIVAHGGWVIVLPAFFGARSNTSQRKSRENLRTWSEQVAIHAAENADTVKMHTLFVREIKIYTIWLVRGLFTKKSGSIITLLHEQQQDGGESGFPFLLP